MKKIAILLAVLLAMIPFAMTEEAVWTAPAAGEALTLEKDLGVVVDGVFYPVFQPADGLLAALGEPVETVSSPSCVFDGEDREHVYEYGSIYTNPIDGADVWYEFYIYDMGMTTTRGLSVGDSVEKMLELYGEGYYSEGEGMYTYSLSGDPEDYGSPCLIFESEDGVIVTIDIYYPTNI